MLTTTLLLRHQDQEVGRQQQGQEYSKERILGLDCLLSSDHPVHTQLLILLNLSLPKISVLVLIKIRDIELELATLKQAYEEQERKHEFELRKKNATIHSFRMSNKELKSKIRALKMQVHRREEKITSFKDIISHLQKEKIVTGNAAELLEKSLTSSALSVIRRVDSISKKKSDSMAKGNPADASGRGIKYDPQIRAFALTLHFYSPRAYDYVRTCFSNCLPNRRTIRGWLSHVKAEPGFTGETMDALRLKAEDSMLKGKRLKVSLSLDDIALKEHIDFDGHKVSGYVDMGDNYFDDTDTEEILSHVKATHACTFMVTCLNDTWKIPCGYFFIKSLGGTDRAALTTECINMLEDLGLEVEALTFDGHASNIAMAHELGASLHDPFNIKPFFPNPSDPSRRINIILDACHMVKLVRNCLGEHKVLFDENGDVINWCFIEELLKLQTEEGLKLANKLAKRHIDWKNHKMRVRVAVQTFSASVADAIEYCATVLNLPNFQGSAATVKFIRIIDRLFDILNSSSPIGKGFKAPLSPSNIEDTRKFLLEAKDYISKLTVSRGGSSILKVPRKTGFLGLITCISSVIDIFDRLVDGTNMRYLLTYKLSQDHLEMFFGCIRQRGGFNNNPTCAQFKAAYKSLILHNEIRTAEKGNCVDQSQIKILSVSSRTFPPLLEEEKFSSEDQPQHPFFEVEECLTEETLQMLRSEAQEEQNIPDVSILSRYVEDGCTFSF
ncbi:UNVERIFIED_CONTAM: hypothetical protein B566_EDAN019065 [Ephemera danica]|nr:hypothetical protein B566_EDAN019065 [Ephemera danica]